VFSIDIDPAFDVDLHADILEITHLDLPWIPTHIAASPPCEGFSPASIGSAWGGGHRAYEPKSETAILGVALMAKTFGLINDLLLRGCKTAIVENPRGVMRKVAPLPPAWTVTYCHFGDNTRMKPTDLWTFGMGDWWPGPPCHNQRPDHPADCCCRDHESAPRGAKTGTQGIGNYADRSVIPEGLAREVLSILTRTQPKEEG